MEKIPNLHNKEIAQALGLTAWHIRKVQCGVKKIHKKNADTLIMFLESKIEQIKNYINRLKEIHKKDL